MKEQPSYYVAIPSHDSIDRLFNFIINNIEGNFEKMTLEQIKQLKGILQRLELNYTKEIINIFTKLSLYRDRGIYEKNGVIGK